MKFYSFKAITDMVDMMIKKKFTSGSWTPGAHTVGKHNANCIITDSVKVHLIIRFLM